MKLKDYLDSKKIKLFPTDIEINKEAQSYDNSLSSMAESIWVPKGFKDGAEWAIKRIKENVQIEAMKKIYQNGSNEKN